MSKVTLAALNEDYSRQRHAFTVAQERFKTYLRAVLAAAFKEEYPTAKTVEVETEDMQGSDSEPVYLYTVTAVRDEEGANLIDMNTEDGQVSYDVVQDEVTNAARDLGWDVYPRKGEVRKIDLDKFLDAYEG